MSAAQRIQQHPLYIQAQTRLAYHVGQLDKEVCFSFSFLFFLFFSSPPGYLTPPSLSSTNILR